MIKISKTKNRPAVLRTNKVSWTKEFLEEIKLHGSYKNLPKEIKEKITKRYKHSDIKKSLVPTPNTKCAFCESIPNESGYVEIEHFFPKSLYPSQVYEWENLLPSCKRCNLKKLSLDTGKFLIVKPDIDDPEEFFSYNNIKITAKKQSSNKTVAKRTIKRLELNGFRLIKPRSELLVSLVDYELSLKKALKELLKAKTKRKKLRLKNNILDSIDKINSLKDKKSKFSGFSRNYISNSKIIKKAEIEASKVD